MQLETLSTLQIFRRFCFDALGRCETKASCQIEVCFGSSPWQHAAASTNVKVLIAICQYLETAVFSNHRTPTEGPILTSSPSIELLREVRPAQSWAGLPQWKAAGFLAEPLFASSTQALQSEAYSAAHL